MPEEKKKPVHPAHFTAPERDERGHPARSTEPERDERRHPETNFLPPLKMFLAFLDKESHSRKKRAKHEDSDEKKVEKLIEKLSESEKDK